MDDVILGCMYSELDEERSYLDLSAIVDSIWTLAFDLAFDSMSDYSLFDCRHFVVDYSSYFDKQLVVEASY